MFQVLFETAPDAMIVVDRDGRIVLANPQAHALFGYAPETLPGAAVEELLPAHVRSRHHAHRARYMASPRVRPMGAGQELTARRRDGAEFPVEIALSPIDAGDGVRHFVASIRDISETQRARQALARARYDSFVAQAGQLALESPLETVFESLPDLLRTALGVDAIGIAFATPERDQLQLRASVGLEAGALDVIEVTASPDDPLPRVFAGRPVAIEEPDENPVGSAAAFLHAGFAGVVLVPLFDAARPMGALLALSRLPRAFDRDAVHFLQSAANMLAAAVQRHRTQEQLAHSQRLDAVGQLTGGIAHDFNNLLTIISGNLQMLEADLADRPHSQETIASALRAVGRGAELTRKLLAFARRQRLSPQSIAVAPMLAELGQMLRRTLGEQISVEVEHALGLVDVFADAAQLDAALVNLALNARDAMPRGGRLSISAREEVVEPGGADELKPGRYVVLAVADTGLGMTAEVLGRAFEPFFTTKEPGKGSGLGLSMVYGFVRQSGGRLRADSRLGYGTRIELQLPAAKTAAAPVAASSPATRGDETVLVVEDEPEVRGIAMAFLRSLGYRVHQAGDATEALQQLREDPQIALLFSDVVLGSGPSGGELAREARRLRPGLAVLLTSGYERPASGDGEQPGSEFELLRKPYRREELAAAVRRALDAR